MMRRKNAQNQGNKLRPDKKGRVGISESSTHGALFLEKVFCGLCSGMTFADVNKIKSFECSVSE